MSSRNKGPYAQHFHLTPEQGLLNDPNGLCYFQGYYHIFYQYNPYATDHSTKYWGHVRTKDFVTYEQLPVALKSDDWFDKNGVYSGGAIVHEETLYLFYTGNTKDEAGRRTSYQCIATSTDGVHFTKLGPVTEQLPDYTGHVRDPKVWYDATVQGWWMLLGAQRLDKTGDTVAFFSKDLKDWDYRGSIFQFDQPLGYMWECPDMVFLTDEVTGQDKAVFIFSPQGVDPIGDSYHNIFNTTYLVGTWDSQTGRFLPDNADFADMQECDRGFEYYAPQSFVAPDGRVIQYSWMGITWPDQEAAIPTRQDDWIHHLTIPRQLRLVDGKLYQTPIAELEGLAETSQSLDWNAADFRLDLAGRAQRVQVDFGSLADWELFLDDNVTVKYQAAEGRLSLARFNWLTGLQEWRHMQLEEELKHLDLWLDASSLEVFVNGGQVVASLRYFAKEPLSRLEGKASAGLQAKLVATQLAAHQYI